MPFDDPDSLESLVHLAIRMRKEQIRFKTKKSLAAEHDARLAEQMFEKAINQYYREHDVNLFD